MTQKLVLLGHGGHGPAADYSLAALAADNLAMGDHDLVVGHAMGGATATLAAARRLLPRAHLAPAQAAPTPRRGRSELDSLDEMACRTSGAERAKLAVCPLVVPVWCLRASSSGLA